MKEKNNLNKRMWKSLLTIAIIATVLQALIVVIAYAMTHQWVLIPTASTIAWALWTLYCLIRFKRS